MKLNELKEKLKEYNMDMFDLLSLFNDERYLDSVPVGCQSAIHQCVYNERFEEYCERKLESSDYHKYSLMGLHHAYLYDIKNKLEEEGIKIESDALYLVHEEKDTENSEFYLFGDLEESKEFLKKLEYSSEYLPFEVIEERFLNKFKGKESKINVEWNYESIFSYGTGSLKEDINYTVSVNLEKNGFSAELTFDNLDDEAEKIVNRVEEQLGKPFYLDGKECFINNIECDFRDVKFDVVDKHFVVLEDDLIYEEYNWDGNFEELQKEYDNFLHNKGIEL